MSFIGFIIFGLIVGFLARFLLPGTQKMGWIATLAVGVVGALLGGYIAQAAGISTREDPVSFFMAVLGAIILLVLVQLFRGKRV
jgi:uncharacterized membrane protein YeaQ/YmgE (transglycosylase-associated protein family)